MCNLEGYGSVTFRPTIDERIHKVKLYQKLCHEVMFVIHNQNLDDMPAITFMMHNRLNHMQNLLIIWEVMSDDMCKDRLLGIRVEVTTYTEKVVDGCQLCSGLDLLHLGGIKRTLGGTFTIATTSIDIFLRNCRLKFVDSTRVINTGQILGIQSL